LGTGFIYFSFFGHVWAHGLRNPIFPKNRIYWAPDLFIFHFLGTFGHGLRNPIFPKKSDFLGTGFIFHFLGTFGHGLKNPIFAKTRIYWALSGWSGNFRFLALGSYTGRATTGRN
jgi:hypothetical protein